MSAISSAPVGTLPKARSAMFGHVAIFAVGATSCVQIANVTMTALSVICLLLVPGWLLLTHRGSTYCLWWWRPPPGSPSSPLVS